MKIFILLIKKKEFLPINGHKNLSKTYPLILISMATLKLTIFKAKVLKDGRHKIRVAVCHKQETWGQRNNLRNFIFKHII